LKSSARAIMVAIDEEAAASDHGAAEESNWDTPGPSSDDGPASGVIVSAVETSDVADEQHSSRAPLGDGEDVLDEETRVYANYRGEGQWYPGEVDAVHTVRAICRSRMQRVLGTHAPLRSCCRMARITSTTTTETLRSTCRDLGSEQHKRIKDMRLRYCTLFITYARWRKCSQLFCTDIQVAEEPMNTQAARGETPALPVSCCMAMVHSRTVY